MLERLKQLKDRPVTVALLLGLAAQILFMVHLGRPTVVNFDEFHYVPAARSLLELDQLKNSEHPLVGKELIAFGMAIFGDNPWGWRIMSTLAGSATVVATFTLIFLMIGRMRFAVAGTVFLILNQMLYVQARIAMLDVFLGAFLLWAMVAMLWAMRAPPDKVWRRWLLAAVLWGLAVGSKWAAIPYVAMACLAFLAIRLRDSAAQGGGAAAVTRRMLAGKGQAHWPGMATIPGLLALGLLSIAVYLITFTPDFFLTYAAIPPGRLIPFQYDMYHAQTQVLAEHTYQSDWWTWPIMARPIWYFYEFNHNAQRGVLLIGNPVILWGGLVAVAGCYWAWLREKNRAAGAAALLWTASLGIYIVIPKSLGFFYYYYLSSIFLCVALAVAFAHFDRGRKRGYEEWFGAVALLAFIYFFPIISGAALQDDQGYRFWMWFESWK
ncbi:phospholipid carrier-dependent glycosyltransferase [Stakelama tenebrarum]|uniref:Polyprenol-phosphate-mannose--protein mannosyltransferase n=1 Tax=Stakelama tenebrarum TaxID=2711215 RepID=A0A6G6Y2R5_9SPHN|nr:phospholipid carrier-dependent glycosyltransferase [Sphingosinithalassobacter tenebrarum]QIG79097.1 phospholipid carrier-dependent glycosyltransferase [Sphingosinithalassobacter tenebrarum]